ncbi:NAD(P)/FAD-dependent oxidoreductase [Gillisia sp. Hel1_33_143]|uniref:NAD(P)/FAD-dependent oxidoreductase n=1 Tax=Gillisia sp. Hel1_33_143 TaxID=1336796 RepID=UPI000B803EBF|nr:NAD(P)/FAD-dependent oxidoreductase [Gillisia sp. Hel1_33_143]
MKEQKKVTVLGGGLAGLTAAIHLSKYGFEVCVIEKEAYPRHKVCGEYISAEILPYLKSLELDLEELSPEHISKLIYSTTSGNKIETELDLGGIGLSRYALDHFLYQKAVKIGVKVLQDTVVNVVFIEEKFRVDTINSRSIVSDLVLGAYGKRSNLDKKLKREFIENKNGWLGIKSHYSNSNFPEDTVALHNFEGGYCGLSKTETGAVNVCYLATYKSFKKHKDPEAFKLNVLYKNPYLKEFFENSTQLFDKDLSIAQISFERKSIVEDHILMLGDAAGLIHPLCGNGMAMAMHSAKIASEAIINNYNDFKLDRMALEQEYRSQWKSNFSSRLKFGGILQRVLLNPILAESTQKVVSIIPSILPFIIKKTHGSPIV